METFHSVITLSFTGMFYNTELLNQCVCLCLEAPGQTACPSGSHLTAMESHCKRDLLSPYGTSEISLYDTHDHVCSDQPPYIISACLVAQTVKHTNE